MQLPSKPNADEHDELTKQRMRMVEKQLIKRGISDQRVLHAMSIVPRHEFIPAEWHRAAYRDSALSIDCGQTISQPYTVAFMCQVARLKGNENTLEVGTGSGYGAAVLAKLVKQVHTVERIPQLAHQAQCSLQSLGYNNIDVHIADGAQGLQVHGPYDAIIVTAAASSLPQALTTQLAEGGRLIIPISEQTHTQTMYRFTLQNGKLTAEVLGNFAFVPLIENIDE